VFIGQSFGDHEAKADFETFDQIAKQTADDLLGRKDIDFSISFSELTFTNPSVKAFSYNVFATWRMDWEKDIQKTKENMCKNTLYEFAKISVPEVTQDMVDKLQKTKLQILFFG
jgi:hypothetical protein